MSAAKNRQPALRKVAPPIRLRREHRGQQLLDVALQLFIGHGYQGTSMEDIASAAGVTRPIIYNHFGSKDGIYLACLRRARGELDRIIAAAALPNSTLEERLRGGITGYFTFVERNRDSWSILFGGGVAVAGSAAEEAAELRNATVRGIADLFSGAVKDMDRRTLEAYAHATSGAGEQLAKWWQANPKVKRAQVVEHLMAFAWQGLKPFAAARQR